VLGGVPTGKVRYDNLKPAVAQVLGFSRQRVETPRWTAFRSHYALEAFYCQPGLQGAHEKGGVEGQIGWFRRNHLVPVPEVDSFEHVVAGLATAVRAGTLTADAVALEARKFAETDAHPRADPQAPRTLPTNVVSLTQRRLAQLPPDTRPLPTIAAYDQLLRCRIAEGTGS